MTSSHHAPYALAEKCATTWDKGRNPTRDLNILDSLTLNVKRSNYKIKSGSLPVEIIYRVQYKAMNITFGSGAMKNSYKGEIGLFQTDLQRSHLSVPKPISWNQVSLSQSWTLQEATPAEKPENTIVSQIRQFSIGTISISFQISFSQRIYSSSSVLPEIQTARCCHKIFSLHA
ncbi:hypothetical protein FXO38_19351 [Capsicum annuum]|nr:hypothetical protein FXO38_19351 [Capsicum annuum]KAF3651535.1 hypothetical protein FXO37_17953 [Capsicum annuum]